MVTLTALSWKIEGILHYLDMLLQTLSLSMKKASESSWTHVKELSNTGYLVSLHHCWNKCANMQIFDISQRSRARIFYSFEEVFGGKHLFRTTNNLPCLVTGFGDVSFNPRRGLLGAMSVFGEIAYHLFSIDLNPSKVSDPSVRLCRKSKWPSQLNAADSEQSKKALLITCLGSFPYEF